MKKIIFSEIGRLTDSVAEGLKTNTRRRISERLLSRANDYVQNVHGTGHDFLDYLLEHSPYKVGEVVAVAQKYKDIMPYLADSFRQPSPNYMMDKPGYNNKMFVRADLMPHQISITSVRSERLQDISDEDCLREGIYLDKTVPLCYRPFYTFQGSQEYGTPVGYPTAREAFAALIDKISGKGTWASNPFVFVYDFKLKQ